MRFAERARRKHMQYKYTLRRLRHKIFTGEYPPQIVFLHVPKSAGTSIQSYFADFIGSGRSGKCVRFDTIYEEAPAAIINTAQTARYVGGHIDWSVFEKISTQETFLFTVLRDPVERFLSSFFYLQNFPAHYKDAAKVAHIKRMPFEEFCRSDDKVVRAFTDNILARQFSGSLRRFPNNEEEIAAMVQAAQDHLGRFNYIGFQDNIAGTLNELSSMLNLPPPKSIPLKNVTQITLDEKAPEPKQIISRELAFALAEGRLRGDIEIYRTAQKLFYKNPAGV